MILFVDNIGERAVGGDGIDQLRAAAAGEPCLLGDEHIRVRGWYTAINSLTGILDTSRMGYQHVHNFKNARQLQVREYQETDTSRLPDERYEIDFRICMYCGLCTEACPFQAIQAGGRYDDAQYIFESMYRNRETLTNEAQ